MLDAEFKVKKVLLRILNLCVRNGIVVLKIPFQVVVNALHIRKYIVEI
jgi:hypothetical protein